ncbi:MAG: nucleoside phosphorylase [Bacteroidales bacterium]|nr:nucleoside phosphorylase [Bacteroidales bacterium]
MVKIPDTELILNPDHSLYHIKLRPGEAATNIILVGDPGRVTMVSEFFDDIEFKGSNREITTHTGSYKGKRITVMSTGMGTDNIDIVMNELDALFNIDLAGRIPKTEATTLNIVRIGTSGALQADIPLNSFIVSDFGLGLDGLIYFYEDWGRVIEKEGTDKFISQNSWPASLPRPYLVRSSDFLGVKGNGVVRGITATAPGFFAPQGRSVRTKPAFPHIFDLLKEFDYQGSRVVNFEMESSALFGLGKIFGHNTVSVCLAVANRETREYTQDYHGNMRKLVRFVLDRLAAL